MILQDYEAIILITDAQETSVQSQVESYQRL